MAKEKLARHILHTIRTHKPITARNSLFADGRKEVLSSRRKGLFKWYCCGPTVYDDAHLGHARAYVSFDIIRRIITSLTGTTVDYALGVTDIDDKILDRAAELGIRPQILARKFERRFFEDMGMLNVFPPSKILRVTEHIPELHEIITDLVTHEAAYVADSGNVYFAISSAGKRYAQLDRSRDIQMTTPSPIVGSQQSNADPESEKRDIRDFALWKRSTAKGQHWESPWGTGRPGWHVECSAMVMATLGTHLDLHTGGIDLRFPHHTNELATAEARMGTQSIPLTPNREDTRWSHTWLHAGHLHLRGRKMSKSVKNFITIREFFENGGTADGFRVFCLLHKYSSPVEYSNERLADANAFLSRIQSFLNRKAAFQSCSRRALEHESHNSSMHPRCTIALALHEEIRIAANAIEDALADDFDTPRVMSQIAQLVRASNASLTNGGVPKTGAAGLVYDAAGRLVEQSLHMLGVRLKSTAEECAGDDPQTASAEAMKSLTDLLVLFRAGVRDAARRKDFKSIFDLCDVTRNDLRRRFSVRIADGKDGSSSWVQE